MTRRALPHHPGALIREYLAAKEMTQADLARHSGLTPKHISRIVTGQSGVGTHAAVAIAHALRIDAGVLMRAQADWDLAHMRTRNTSR